MPKKSRILILNGLHGILTFEHLHKFYKQNDKSTTLVAVPEIQQPSTKYGHFATWINQRTYLQNSDVSHHLSATLTESPSEHLILDSHENLRQTLTLVT